MNSNARMDSRILEFGAGTHIHTIQYIHLPIQVDSFVQAFRVDIPKSLKVHNIISFWTICGYDEVLFWGRFDAINIQQCNIKPLRYPLTINSKT